MGDSPLLLKIETAKMEIRNAFEDISQSHVGFNGIQFEPVNRQDAELVQRSKTQRNQWKSASSGNRSKVVERTSLQSSCDKLSTKSVGTMI